MPTGSVRLAPGEARLRGQGMKAGRSRCPRWWPGFFLVLVLGSLAHGASPTGDPSAGLVLSGPGGEASHRGRSFLSEQQTIGIGSALRGLVGPATLPATYVYRHRTLPLGSLVLQDDLGSLKSEIWTKKTLEDFMTQQELSAAVLGLASPWFVVKISWRWHT